MGPRDCLSLAIASILAHRLRSLLTMLGILVGVAAVVILTAVGEGTRRFVLSEFTQFGTNLMAVTPGKVTTSGIPGALGGTIRKLTIEDAEALKRLHVVERVLPLALGMSAVEAEGRSRSVVINGVTADAPGLWKFGIGQGRFLPSSDPRNAAPLVVLGPKLKRELFGEANALGRFVRIGGNRFQVIGVMAPKGQLLGFDIDDSAYIPVRSAQELFGRDDLWEIDLNFTPGLDDRMVAAQVREVLKARHNGEEDFTITTQTEMLDVLGQILGVLNLAVGAIGGVSLVVGAIGILTMMWISVNERTAEIGLLRALGAGSSDVLTLFLVEALLLSVIGGGLGLLCGASMAWTAGFLAPGLRVHVAPLYVGLAIAVSVVVGLVSGVLPARRASRLDPVEALRAE